MKKLSMVTAVLFLSPAAALAAPSFSEVDTDQNGELSFEEAIAAWPALNLVDENLDGQANRSEVVARIPGLVFKMDTEETEYAIDAFDYEDIVKALESTQAAQE